MKILTDYHHHALAESLELLADRFGWELYFPTGMEWFERDYWAFEKKWHGDAVARQYLLGIWPESDDEIVDRPDPRHPGRVNWGVRLDTALSMDWDVVLCSLPHNYDGFHRFAQETGARFALQIGNNLQPFDDRAAFALSSSTLPGFGPEYIGKRFDVSGIPTVMYHQEFSTDYFRAEWPPANRNVIASFVNCFPEGPSYPDFLRIARAHPEFDWRVYGAYGTGADDEFKAGDVSYVPDVADTMRAAAVGWHSKHWSDGFGHTIHNWFSIGRPVVGFESYYADKLAGPLWQHGVTSFDLERMSESELVGTLARLVNDEDYHREISENAARRFAEVVDFDHDAALVKALIESVL